MYEMRLCEVRREDRAKERREKVRSERRGNDIQITAHLIYIIYSALGLYANE